MIINSLGNVGIGTTNPADLLTIYSNEGVSGTGNIKIRIRSHADREGSLFFERGGSTTWELFQKGSGFGATAGNFSFQNSTSGGAIEITQSGNVNIGTSGQSYKLYVNGTTYFNGASTVNGNFNSTGEISSGPANNNYLGGLRINGSDTGNTLYNGTNQFGITALNNIILILEQI
jgi:hypothetical protein